MVKAYMLTDDTASAHMTGNVLELDGGQYLTGWRGKTKGESKI